ncbi:MAG: ABC transporter permease subunit [Myxococcota bacterium]
MSVIGALATASFREAFRNRVTVVLGVFAVVMILLTSVVLNTTVFTLDRAVTDFGLGVMSLLLVGLTIFLSAGLLTREIERRTIFLVVSRPVSRAAFIFGRYLGTLVTLLLLQAVMTGLYLLQFALFDVPLTQAVVAALLGLVVELVLLTAIGFFFSSFSGQLVSGVSAVGLYLIGHLSGDMYLVSRTNESPVLASLARIGYYVLPNLDRLDYRVTAAHQGTVHWGEFAGSCAYGLVYAALLLLAATLIFDRRDFK